jgi:putative peptidoglycan lipid II flippase
LFYSLGIWSIVGVRVITATFYSMQDTRTPVKIAAVAVAANIIFSIILMQPLRHSGLALANSLASGLNFFLLFMLLRKKLIMIDGRRIFSSFIKIVIASTIMGVSAGLILHGTLWQTYGRTFQKVLYLSGMVILCVGVYLGVIFLLKSEELNSLVVMIRQKFRK